MEFIIKNFKKANVFNMVMIAIALALNLYSLTLPVNYKVEKINTIINIFALLVGFLYSFSGYKKDVAPYYKGFMILYVMASILNVGIGIYDSATNSGVSASIIVNAFKTVCIVLLAFKNDFGKSNSFTVALVILGCTLFLFISSLLASNSYASNIIERFDELLFASITCVFVCAKYLDKQNRGRE